MRFRNKVSVFYNIYIFVDINHKSYDIVIFVILRNRPRQYRRGLFFGPKGAK
jgi:hypothetical protein